MGATVNIAHQAFILARLSEFCRFQAGIQRYESDPWSYMRSRLVQMEPELAALKSELLEGTRRKLLADLKAGPLSDEVGADYRQALERLVGRGDFVDLAVHLMPGAGKDAAAALEREFSRIKANHAFLEERLPPEQRSPSWEKLIAELAERLDLVRLEQILKRKPRSAKRKAMVLRRLRRNVAEYCTVVRIPKDVSQTFTPFMLPRIEALIAACLRFLDRYR
jgi:hypothetical protein